MIVAFVPVRIGSKSIPKKNIKEFCGKPLILWCLESLAKCSLVEKVIIASDSTHIDQVVESAGINKAEVYRRDPANATDSASTESVMLEYIGKSKHSSDDTFILVQATNPFIQEVHIKEALSLIKTKDSVLSGVREKRFYWTDHGTPINYDYQKRPRRQDFHGIFKENGAFYISKVGNILKTKNRISGDIGLYEMPEYTQLEIDEIDDWHIAEKLFYKYHIQTNKLGDVRLFATDVDGVLTDCGMYYGESGEELKKFNTRDGKAFELLRNKGIKTAIITTENTQIVARRSNKVKADFLKQGAAGAGKLKAIKEICADLNIGLEQVLYVGDDLNCREALENVGHAFCPMDAEKEVQMIPNVKTIPVKGGNGVIRYLANKILSSE